MPRCPHPPPPPCLAACARSLHVSVHILCVVARGACPPPSRLHYRAPVQCPLTSLSLPARPSFSGACSNEEARVLYAHGARFVIQSDAMAAHTFQRHMYDSKLSKCRCTRSPLLSLSPRAPLLRLSLAVVPPGVLFNGGTDWARACLVVVGGGGRGLAQFPYRRGQDAQTKDRRRES